LEVTKDDMDIVSAIGTALAGKVGKERFEMWFGGRTQLEVVDGTLTVGASSEFLRDWLRTHFRAPLEAACQEVLGPSAPVVFVVASTVPNAQLASPSQSSSTTNPDESNATPNTSSLKLAVAPPDSPEVKLPASNRRSRREAALDFRSFVRGQDNKLARAAAEMVAGQPGEFSPLLIHGPTSVGKTHLLQAICTEARRQTKGLSTIYLSAEQFTSEFLQALRGGGLPSFRARYRGLDLLAIDDLHFFCGKRATLVELLYTIDALIRRRRQVVFAADRAPCDLRALGGELLSRLEAGMACRIEPADYATRLGILGRMSQKMGIALSPEVSEFVAAQLTNHARELSGALCRLHALSRVNGRSITLDMAQETLGEMIRDGSRVIRLADIEKAVCDTFGLEKESLQSGRKAKAVSHPRMLAMWLARKYTRAALSEIGQYFGRRSHSTVVSAQKRVERWIADDATLHLAEQSRTVSDAIQQLEQRIRVS
jgi:chromosomal replication initiator protein